MLWLTIALLGAWALPLGAVQEEEARTDLEGLLEGAAGHLEAGRVDYAIRIYDQAVMLDPGSLEARQARARAELAADRPGRAVEVLARAGQDFLTYGLLEEADQVLAEALEIASREGLEASAGLWALRGRALVLAERWDEAATALETALEMAEAPEAAGGLDGARTRLYLGAALWEAERYPEAEAAYRAVASDPTTPSGALFLARHQLGRLLAWVGRPEEAVDPLRRASEMSPGALDTLLDLARAQAAAGQGADAVATFRRVVVLDPDSSRARWGLAQALLARGQEGDREAAAEELAVYRELYAREQEETRRRGLAASRLDRGRAQLAAGDPAAAAATFRELGSSVEALDGLARALALQGDHAGAVRALEEAVALSPERRDLRLRLTVQRVAVLEARAGGDGGEDG